jgi:hypothetical protein
MGDVIRSNEAMKDEAGIMPIFDFADFDFQPSDFSIFSLYHTKTCRSLQTTASFSPSGRDLSALLGSE